MRTFLKTFVAIGAVLAWSGSALGVVNIGISGNTGGAGFYTAGDVLTVTITGDSGGATAGIVRAVLTVSPSLSFVSGVAGVLNDSNATFQWQQTADAGTCGNGPLASNECTAVDAYEYLTLGGVAIDVLPSTLSTFQFGTGSSSGTLNFSFAGQDAGFFGLTALASLNEVVVPEPGTAGLLGLGLVSLAFAGRRRR